MDKSTLQGVGIVLKEQMTALSDEIARTRADLVKQNAVMEGGFFKRFEVLEETVTAFLGDLDDHKTRTTLEAEEIRGEITGRQEKTFAAIEALRGELDSIEANMRAAVAVDGERARDRLDERAHEITAQLENRLATVEKSITAELMRSLKGEKGDRGEKGEDAGASASKKWTPGNEFNDKEIITHRGGLWRCTGKTLSEPDAGDDRWILVANGIDSIETRHAADFAELHIRTSDGAVRTVAVEAPAPNFTDAVWDEKSSYSLRDVVWKDGHSFIALTDDPQGQPGTSEDWAKYTMRGRQGRRGEAGPAGPAGKDGRDAPGPEQIRAMIREILAEESDS